MQRKNAWIKGMRNVRPNKLTSVWGIDLPWNFWEHFGPMSRIKKELLSHSSLVVGILQHEQGGRGGNHTPKIYYAACRTLQLREGSVALGVGGSGLIFRAFFSFFPLWHCSRGNLTCRGLTVSHAIKKQVKGRRRRNSVIIHGQGRAPGYFPLKNRSCMGNGQK